MLTGRGSRCGELAKRIEPNKGGRPKTQEGGRPSLRASAANGAGLSAHQLKQAIRVANVPTAERFEAAEAPQVASEKVKSGSRKR